MLYMEAIDLGASSGRVVHAGFDGYSLQMEETHRFINQPLSLGHTLHWNIYSILNEVKAGIFEAANKGNRVVSIGIDSWAVDFGFLEPGGQLVGLPGHYRDPRNLGALKEVETHIDRKALFHRTGIQINPINTLYQLYAFKKNSPKTLESVQTFLMIPDLLNYFLTGEIAAEFTNATTTQFLTLGGEWDLTLLSDLGLPTEIWPPLTLPGQTLGPLTDQELRHVPELRQTLITHTMSHDTAAAVVCVPHEEEHFVYISSGTWSLMGTVVDSPIITPDTQRFNLTNEGGFGNYRLLKNVMGLWLIQEFQKELRFDRQPADIEMLLSKASAAAPFTWVFDPDDTRLLRPTKISQIIQQICHETGQIPPIDTGHMVRGILESLALKYRQVFGELEIVTNRCSEIVHIVGGGSQNALLSQFAANSMNATVVAGPVEASAMGNTLGQLVALGEVSMSDTTSIVKNSTRLKIYRPQDPEIWHEEYGEFRRISRIQAEYAMMF